MRFSTANGSTSSCGWSNVLPMPPEVSPLGAEPGTVGSAVGAVGPTVVGGAAGVLAPGVLVSPLVVGAGAGSEPGALVVGALPRQPANTRAAIASVLLNMVSLSCEALMG